LWQRPFASLYTSTSITPMVYDDSIIVSGLNFGVSRFRPVQRNGRWFTETVWQNMAFSLFTSNGVLINDTLYGLAYHRKGHFFALDAVTGETLWSTQGRQADNTAIVKAGGLLFLLNDDAFDVGRASHTTSRLLFLRLDHRKGEGNPCRVAHRLPTCNVPVTIVLLAHDSLILVSDLSPVESTS
jgi:outer membrane protein assembly factor BamB